MERRVTANIMQPMAEQDLVARLVDPVKQEKLDRVFDGNLEDLPSLSSKIVRIFTSSTFTDTTLERNALMENVYPKLKEYCKERHGLEFQVVDMRWGVRDEATDDHMTTTLCLQEIETCQRLSMGPNFVVFLGQKYGYRPIPTHIPSRVFNLIRECSKSIPSDLELLDQWYQSDFNTVPPVNILQPISTILTNFNNKRHQRLQEADQSQWWETMGKLQKILRKAAQVLFITKKIDREHMHNFFMSVTEREVEAGILKAKNTQDHCLAYVRSIENVNTTLLRFASKFVDFATRSVDNEAQKLLKILRDEKLKKSLPQENLSRFSVEWSGKEGIERESHQEYLDQFCEEFHNNVIRLVDRAMENHELLSNDPQYTDILQHLHACRKFCKLFQGREEVVDKIQQYILGPSNQPLVLYGESGCGKTSLMAKGASQVVDWNSEHSSPGMVLRFLGTSPNSSSIIPLLTSLCHQVAHITEQDKEDIPDELALLAAHLKKLLTLATPEKPLTIFLDSLDQLSGADGAHQLSWLPVILPPDVKIVLSTLPNYYGILETLRTMIDEEDNFVQVTPLGENLSSAILKSWLERGKRDVTEDQWEIVNDAITKCNLPLFVKLVFDEICTWKSYSKPSMTTLAYTIHDTIIKLFDKIEVQHGKTLVSHALGYITASKSGLSEAELEDLLSLDEKVLNDVYQYHLPPVRRIPPLLWTRIRNDLPGYFSEREADGVNVINWYHRQFIDASNERYFRNINLLSEIHLNLAEYFLGTWGGGNPKPFEYSEQQRQRFGLDETIGEADRGVPLQPLSYNDEEGKIIRYNFRKLSELPYHLIRSHRYDDLYQEVLFNYKFLFAKLSSMPLHAVLNDFEEALGAVFDKDTKLLSDTLRLSASVLSHYPEMLGPEITGRLLPYYFTNQKIRILIQQCDRDGIQRNALVPSYHCLHTPGGPLQYSLEGHPFAPFGIASTSDARYLVSVSNRFIIWDLDTGEVFRTVNPSIEGIMQNLDLSPNNKYAVSYTNNNQVLVCAILTGEYSLLDTPTDGTSPIIGTSVDDNHFAVYTTKEWYLYNLDCSLVSKNSASLESPLIQMKLYNNGEHYMILKSGEENDKDMTLAVYNGTVESFEFHSAITINKEKTRIYCCIEISDNAVAVYRKEGTGWAYERTLSDNSDPIFTMTLANDEHYLAATIKSGYKLWNLKQEKIKVLHLKLPSGIQNIPTKPPSSPLVTFTRNNYFVMTGVRKNIYVWDVKSGSLVKTLDAHFGRIHTLTAATSNGMNKVFSSSLDKTIKVWNIDNVYEDVHSIDRLEKPIESISLAEHAHTGVTITRNCVGVWNLENGRLDRTLANSSHSSIITHAAITADGQHVISAESGNVIIWNLQKDRPVKTDSQRDVFQILLADEDKNYISFSKIPINKVHCICREIPSGNQIYTFDFNTKKYKESIMTGNSLFLVVITVHKTDEILALYHSKTGTFLYNMPLKYNNFKEIHHLRPMPNESTQIAIIDCDKGNIFDVKKKSLVRSIPKWNGICSQNGKLGLYAPNRGGLQLLDLKTGKLVHTLIPRVAEGVFSVNALFTKNDQHVAYYHSGHRTIRVFRVSDGKKIATFRAHAEVNAIEGTSGGSSLVLGAVDGSLTMLTIADPIHSDSVDFLQALPSRQVSSVYGIDGSTNVNINGAASIGMNGKGMGASVQVARFVAKAKQAQKSRACVVS